MVESEGRAPTILHSFQHPSAVQNKLKILADTDGWVSARNGSAQPGNEGIMPSGMAATTGKHLGSTPPHHSTLLLSHISSGVIICKPTEKENSPLLFGLIGLIF